ncbi:MAG TPA: hypothetical protein VKT71_00620 [Candidatus Acidoferrales bacterium]|nr:hypothetical protein [Candidatus Acidoferrales bacterium]
MAEETFRLPKSSYDELVKIVKGYFNSGQEANLTEVSQTAAMDPTVISRNNAFLISVGIISAGKAKGITEKGKLLAHALQFDVQEDISSRWREIATSNEFLQKMVTAVSIRGGMEDTALQSHIAYSAGESKSAGVMTGAGAVVQILKVAGLVREQDGKLLADPSTMGGISPVLARTILKHPENAGPSSITEPRGVPQQADSKLNVSIQIQIQCTFSEISELGPKIRSLLKELNEDSKAEGH